MEKAIGVIGGVGPQAGLDLVQKVLENTIASSDQEHIDLYLTSIPSKIADRTAFLLEQKESPLPGLKASFDKLATIGASVIVIPCNTAHAPPIYGELANWAKSTWPQVRLLNMIEETVKLIEAIFDMGTNIGLLATLGTHRIGIYRQYFEKSAHLTLLEPDDATQKEVHQAIYDKEWGIKASYPPTERARETIRSAAEALAERGAKAIVLGCTELPLALGVGDVPFTLLDPTLILARAAIRETAIDKLKDA
ncbi:MAG: amino acid racemase [Sphaerochaeta sp.]